MKSEEDPSEPNWKSEPTWCTDQKITIRSVVRLNDISHEDMNVSLPSISEDLSNVNSCGIPGIHRRRTFASTEQRVGHPRIKPVPNVG